MSDPTQNPPPHEGSSTPSEPASEQTPGQAPPPRQDSSTPPPPPPPPSQAQGQGQGSYGTGSAPPPPPAGSQQPGASSAMGVVGQPGELLPRFLARLIDYILLAIVNAVLVSFVVLGLFMSTNDGNLTGLSVGLGSGRTYAANAVSDVLTALIALGYFSLMEARLGRTIGKMILKLETRGPGGGHPTFEQAVKRNAFTAIGILGVIPFLGFVSGLLSLIAVITIAVTIANNSNRHGWHDDFAGGTTVYKVG